MVYYRQVYADNKHNVFDEHIYYSRNEIQKHFKTGILEYAEHMHEIF